jgi:hypothetical protein
MEILVRWINNEHQQVGGTMKTPVSILFGFLCASAFCQVGEATIRRVPSQYATIQAGIDAAVNGDTVLVSDNTYFENIRFKGKKIVVASAYLTTGDTSHISLTVINGSKPTNPDSGSVVYFINGEDTTSVLCGFTITGGSGTNWYLDRWYREGGGIFCLSSGARIVENYITRNRIDGTTGDGGGVWVVNMTSSLPYLILEQNRITDNFVRGTLISESMWVCAGGAAVFSTSARIVGNLFESDSAAATYGAGPGGLAFQGFPDGPYPTGIIQGNTFRGNVATTLQRGAFGGGMVVEHTGPVSIMDNLFEGNIAVSAGGYARGGGLWIGDRYLPSNIAPVRKFILRNRFLQNRTSSTYWGTGGAIELDATMAAIAQNEIFENTALGTLYGGGGIWVYASSCRIENNLIARNSAIPSGGGIQISVPPMPLRGTDQTIVNNTIVDNHATSGGGLSITGGANVVSLNNILWADTAQSGQEIYVSGGTAIVHYCNLQGGWPSDTGNIDSDPLFVTGDSLLNLTVGSPCIGRGVDSMQLGGVWYHAPAFDYDGNPRHMPIGSQQCDIGAQEEQITVDVKDGHATMPKSFALEQNYPNPFNPSTTIKYELPKSSVVRLSVYDIIGREVSVLVNERRDSGVHEIKFDGSNLASGVYFYRLQAGDFVQSKRLVLLK